MSDLSRRFFLIGSAATIAAIHIPEQIAPSVTRVAYSKLFGYRRINEILVDPLPLGGTIEFSVQNKKDIRPRYFYEHFTFKDNALIPYYPKPIALSIEDIYYLPDEKPEDIPIERTLVIPEWLDERNIR
jgi:hypothetical protein